MRFITSICEVQRKEEVVKQLSESNFLIRHVINNHYKNVHFDRLKQCSPHNNLTLIIMQVSHRCSTLLIYLYAKSSAQHILLQHRSAENCSIGLRLWCNTYCLQACMALFVFVLWQPQLYTLIIIIIIIIIKFYRTTIQT